jgi:HD-GYP domain-containing protein (c-di-GMP phosphodiesterase class II)
MIMSGENPTSKELLDMQMPNFAPRLYGISILVGGIIAVGIWLVSHFAAADLARDVRSWQEKLNLVAESRELDVSQWVGNHYKELRTLSANPSLQLYMGELQSPQTGDGEPPEKAYLRNLLLFTANRAGFSSDNPASSIPADVKVETQNSLAVINRHNEVMVSTPMQAPIRDLMLQAAAAATPAHEMLIDIRKQADGVPVIGFLVPVFSIQGQHDAASQIGWVAGIKKIDSNLFGMLTYPGISEKSLEIALVRKIQDNIDYISPLMDGTGVLGKQIPLSQNVAAGKLIQSPGDFIRDMRDYRGKAVLATSRAIAGTPWVLVVKIDRDEALATSNQQRQGMVIFLCMLIAVIVLIVIALWRFAHSKRAMMMSGYFRALAARTMAQEQLLRLVTDNQPEALYIVDAGHTIHFANAKAAANVHMSPGNLAGKTLQDVRGAAAAAHIATQCDTVIGDNDIAYDTTRATQDGSDAVTRSVYVPLMHIPLDSLPNPTPGVLVIEQDISEVVHEREERLDTQRQLIETLVRLVDRRDPFAANHSMLVAHIASDVALAMGLDNTTVETTRIAGSLMNIGKIIVPTELLTKAESLTVNEMRAVHDSMSAAAELLKDIHFEGPVTETLRQWQEKWDGTGPLGLHGDAILISARIIAAANAFVGMISPRSWRTALPIEAASKFLLDESDRLFDRRVVAALVNHMENNQGREWLKTVMESQRPIA